MSPLPEEQWVSGVRSSRSLLLGNCMPQRTPPPSLATYDANTASAPSGWSPGSNHQVHWQYCCCTHVETQYGGRHLPVHNLRDPVSPDRA